MQLIVPQVSKYLGSIFWRGFQRGLILHVNKRAVKPTYLTGLTLRSDPTGLVTDDLEYYLKGYLGVLLRRYSVFRGVWYPKRRQCLVESVETSRVGMKTFPLRTDGTRPSLKSVSGTATP